MLKRNYRLFISVFTLIIFLIWYSVGSFFSPFLQSNFFNTLGTTFIEISKKSLKKNNITTNQEIDLKLLWETYNIIKENYYSFDSISKKDIVYGIIKGFTQSLKDKHTEYFTPEETEKFNEALNGDFEGIGAVILESDFGVFVDRILAGSPAKEADIRSGDIITKANNIELKGLELSDAVKKIRWPAGSKVTLEIIRAGELEKITKEVVRRKIEVPSVDSKTLSGSIGYITLSIFWEKTAEDFEKQLSALYTQNINGLIIDLRDNGWGFLDSAVSILSNFIEKDKVLVTTKEKNPFLNRSYFSAGSTLQKNKKIPIVILINGNSASASEITAGALKDYKLAILVGEKSYGKGSVQEPFTLSDGSEIKVTVAKWYTPLDHGIDGIGIKPDKEVEFKKEDYEKKYDRQLEEGKKILEQYISGGYEKTINSLTTTKEVLSTENGKIQK